ncbi:MAG: membrane protein [marine bacterium B5-7]|nr:MAG: membrane protein [marine bacterium B5-7]
MRSVFCLTTIILFWSTGILAETPQQQGHAVVSELHARDTGWHDQFAKMKMILTNRQGETSTREVRMYTLEVPGDGDKSLSIFDAPADVRGTAFLSHTHALQPDDQWLYLPALKRVKRISSANKSGPFMGSEFAYEDIASQEIDKFTYKLVAEETIDGNDAFVVEQYPQYEKSGYTREVVWIDKARYIPLKLDYYDRKDALLKTLTFSDYQQYLDKYWRAGEMYMENHQTGKRSTLTWTDYSFRQDLDDHDFDRSVLKRLR